MIPTARFAVSAFASIAISIASAVSAQPASIGMLEITGALPERSGALAGLGGGDPTLHDYIDTIDRLGEEGELDGVILRLKDVMMGTTKVEELGAAITRAQEAGLNVHLFSEMYGMAEFLLGAYATEVIVQVGGPVSLPGIYLEEYYLADTFDKFGFDASFVQVGDYKGADEMFTRAEPSEAWDENISGLLDGLYGEFRTTLMEGRELTPSQLDAAMAELWLADAEEAVEFGLADAAIGLDEIMGHLEERYGEVDYAGEIDAGGRDMQFNAQNPFAMLAALTQPPRRDATEPTIAVLHLSGPIVDGDSSPAGLLGGASTGSRTLRRAMQNIADDEEIRGVVVRIDSPGGSATASEVIWRGMRDLGKDIPVWTSVGSMAASGGYYTAVGGQRIYVNPSSIVGSIGVVGGKVAIGGFLGKGEINVVSRSRGPQADLLSAQEPWNETEKALVRDKLVRVYEQFTDRVETGRPGIDIDRVGAGRLFIGREAVELEMADELGGLQTAIADMASELDLVDYEVMSFPAPKSLEEVLEDAFGGFMQTPDISAGLAGLIEQALGAQRFAALRDQLSAMMQLRETPVLLVSPRAVITR